MHRRLEAAVTHLLGHLEVSGANMHRHLEVSCANLHTHLNVTAASLRWTLEASGVILHRHPEVSGASLYGHLVISGARCNLEVSSANLKRCVEEVIVAKLHGLSGGQRCKLAAIWGQRCLLRHLRVWGTGPRMGGGREASSVCGGVGG